MNRLEQVKICKTCENRGFDPRKGVICSLTNDIASFDDKCDAFQLDKSIESLQNYRHEQNIKSKRLKNSKKKFKIDNIREPEKITKLDMKLLLAISLSALFIIRLFIYIDYNYQLVTFNIPISIVIIVATAASIYIRNKSKKFIANQNIKFIAVMALMLSVLNIIYVIITHSISYYLIVGFILFALFSFLVSIASMYIYLPIHNLVKKIRK